MRHSSHNGLASDFKFLFSCGLIFALCVNKIHISHCYRFKFLDSDIWDVPLHDEVGVTHM